MNAKHELDPTRLESIARLRAEANRMRAEALRELFAQWRAALSTRFAPRPASGLRTPGCG
jgi:hypothetical protein